MKQKILYTVRVVAFLCVMISLIVASSYLLAPKDNTPEGGIKNPVAHGFLSEPKNTIDIAVIGNSDAYGGFSPMELWNRYGYTAYVGAEGKQSVAQSYVMFKNMLEVQTPKILILETDSVFDKNKLGISIAKMLNAQLGGSLSVFEYHDRWKRVRAKELLKKPNYTAHNYAKGQMLSNTVKPYYGKEYMNPTDEKERIPVASRRSLNTIIETCREREIELLLVELPSRTSWNMRRHNGVQDWADRNGVPFLDLNLDRDSFHFNWKQDTRDKGNHLNTSGARKVTLHIGKYLSEHYTLPDHRNDGAYARWHEDFQVYLKEAKI